MPRPKVKRARRLGVPLTPKAARVMEGKPHPPGQHGRRRAFTPKISAYGRQLREKQRLRAQYNIRERQLTNYVRKAINKAGNPVDNLIHLLEMRLDVVVLRGGLATTIYAARQYVSHRHILVNGRRVDIPSYLVSHGDIVSVKPESRDLPQIVTAVENAQPVPYVELDRETMALRVLRLPDPAEVPIICELPLVIEYYAR
jgi:small subunit ribosomal protein S4